MTCLYLLRTQEASAFKIGVSQNPYSRGIGLPQKIDWANSLQAKVVDGDAYKAERVLHYLFREHRRPMQGGSGYTEWFDGNAWAQVVEFVSVQQGMLGVGPLEPVPVPAYALCEFTELQTERFDGETGLRELMDQVGQGEIVAARSLGAFTGSRASEVKKLVSAIRNSGATLSIPGIFQPDLDASHIGEASMIREAVHEKLLMLIVQLAKEDTKGGQSNRRGRIADMETHERILALRSGGHTIADAARLAGCSESQVKRVTALNRNRRDLQLSNS